MKSRLFILIIGSIAVIPASAQKQKPDLKSYSLGVRAMHLYDLPVNFYDDALSGEDMQGLNGDETQFDLGFEVFAEKMFTPLFGLQLGYRNGGLTGANDVEYYKNTIWEAGLDARFVLSNLALNRIGNPWGFYVKPGIAYGQADAKRYLQEDGTLNNQLDVKYWNIRMGAGVQFQFSKNFRAEVEIIYNTVLHDGFDGFNYAKGFDAYLNTSLGLVYTFGNKDKPSMGAVNYFSDEYLGSVFNRTSQTKTEETAPVINRTPSARDSLLEADLKSSQKRMNELERELAQQKEALRKMAESKVDREEKERNSSMTNQIFVYFEFDSYSLSEEAKKALWEKANRLRSESIRITAYADKTGQDAYNQSLKNKRAESVKLFLKESLGIPEENIKTELGTAENTGRGNDFLNRKAIIEF